MLCPVEKEGGVSQRANQFPWRVTKQALTSEKEVVGVNKPFPSLARALARSKTTAQPHCFFSFSNRGSMGASRKRESEQVPNLSPFIIRSS